MEEERGGRAKAKACLEEGAADDFEGVLGGPEADSFAVAHEMEFFDGSAGGGGGCDAAHNVPSMIRMAVMPRCIVVMNQ